jgi:glycerol kinase
VRAAVVRADLTIDGERARPFLPSSPAPGLVEFDPAALATIVLEVARESLDAAGPVDAVGVATQRASTVLWERATGRPVGPGIGWQDLRTIGECLVLQGQGIRLAPNVSATKLAHLLDQADPDRTADLCFGTVDSWVVWALTEGRSHITDLSNAAVTGMMKNDASGWSPPVLQALRVPEGVLPEVVDSTGVVAEATALPGAPPIAGLAGDQQASLIGQGCVRPGLAKATFGTGGMLDLCFGPDRPSFPSRGPAGTFPIVAWREAGAPMWGVEAIMLSAGTAVEWLRDDLGVLDSSAASAEVAAACDDTGDVWFVPALLGLGTPDWDHGARGTVLGLTRGTGRPQLVRAVLEGVAHRGADLLEAAESDAGLAVPALRVDGGMAANPVFTAALADACARPVEVSPVLEATTLGAAFLAGLAVGTWRGWDDVAAAWSPASVVEPTRTLDRDRWREARSRARAWIPDLSALDF